MTDFNNAVLKKAFDTFPGQTYNDYRSREQNGDRNPVVYYEVSLLQHPDWEAIRTHLYPSFVRFLKVKLINPETAVNTVVAIFDEQDCHLLEGKVFLEIFRELEGLDESAFHSLVLSWLSTE